jgi:hypothetical protein
VKATLVLWWSLGISLIARGLPEGDKHVIAINKQFNTLSNAYTVFVKTVEERRPFEQVARTLEVVADELDELFLRLSQFEFWLKVDPRANEKFSKSGREQAQILSKRKVQKPPLLDASIDPYGSDPRIVDAEARITAVYNKFGDFTR